MGNIQTLKMQYHCRFYHNLLRSHEVGQSNPKKINVLDAMDLAISFWTIDAQENRSITNCFQHCKIRSLVNMASKILSDSKLLSVMGNNREDEVEHKGSIIKSILCKEALKSIMKLNNFLL